MCWLIRLIRWFLSLFSCRSKGRGITLLVPFRPDTPWRAGVWDWLSGYWKAHLPAAQLIVMGNDKTPFCKTEAVNDAAREASGDIFVILDSDCYMDPKVLVECARRIRKDRRRGVKTWFIPYRHFFRLTRETTLEVLHSSYKDPMTFPSPPPASCVESMKGSSFGHWWGALIQIMPREAFVAAGGMDERFAGWGGEDAAMMRAVDTMYAKHRTTDNQVLHLWHPKTGEVKDSKDGGPTRVWDGQEDSHVNDYLTKRYHEAFGDYGRMWSLISEPGHGGTTRR